MLSVLDEIQKTGRASKKFIAFIYVVSLLFGAMALGLQIGVASSFLERVQDSILFLTLGYLGSQAGLDAGVRIAAIRSFGADNLPELKRKLQGEAQEIEEAS